ncbi:MAG: flavodoxin-dependent (E)-4-hydroxy-3-methylbut-2-enyl-diphosphate synthase [Candidatus Sumerlaeia bacterium]
MTHPVLVGGVQVGGGAPIVVQSMTLTDTSHIEATVAQVLELAEAGSELVRITVNMEKQAQAVAEIRRRLNSEGCRVPLVGDFHYNGHLLLRKFPECAAALDKFRINPGNVGRGRSRDPQFTTICQIARDLGKPVRIGVNLGSLDQDLVMAKMKENSDRNLGLDSDEIYSECMIESALRSTELALAAGLTENQIIISCKCSKPTQLIHVYRELSSRTRQPLHLGLTEAGPGMKGAVWSSTALAVLLAEGIGDTIRVSLTPRPGGPRREEVDTARNILQSLGLRSFEPVITACPGCGRTTDTTYLKIAERVEAFKREKMPEWKRRYPGVEQLNIAVMGCIVNGPGESKAADIGISLPGTGEAPTVPLFIDGKLSRHLKGRPDDLAEEFCRIIEEYLDNRFGRTQPVPDASLR